VIASNARDDHGLPLNFKSTTVTCVDPATEVVVTLEQGGEVTGSVVGPEGEPVEGAKVKAAGAASCTTEADGKFRLAPWRRTTST